ncbi:uncharacterized protein KY384_002293 [Bacidia gigantensis]|uniref:uncharacterized protein n=1 Tax=Bacidia gigantensis TaxID=2732470 RepID=UPI001D0374FC|nr:uncharacterized protein KY384_002293 [Bacidia gigantensis]KAG8533507.1 hypothetical protein KY384_002293 [Bacidia gigantensis]
MLNIWSAIAVPASFPVWAIRVLAVLLIVFTLGSIRFIPANLPRKTRTLRSQSGKLGKFFYASFLKPHSSDVVTTTQQNALESFYKSQADAYDATRRILLRGREDMLGLVAAQLKYKEERGQFSALRPIWVDMGGGTGYNIEAMQQYLDVPTFFAKVILVDLSPSLLEVARRRFARLGWDVEIVCEDARSFQMLDHMHSVDTKYDHIGADLVTMSYSLSMIPDYYNVLDSTVTLLSPEGIIGVVDFYVQSVVERDLYSPTEPTSSYAYKIIETVDASCSQSPPSSPELTGRSIVPCQKKLTAIDAKSKAGRDAIINLGSNLPLPSLFYQNSHRRLCYDDHLDKHTRFKNEYIYTFTWEDPRVDHRLLKMKSTDAVLCIASAGDNVLDYILEANPARIHAVDMNPNQNHLLELKIAAAQTLPYAQYWKMFGEGKLSGFRDILIEKLSPQMSSQACQYWLNHSNTFDRSHGLYETGGSRHAIILIRRLFKLLRLTKDVRNMCNVKTLNEQRELWPKIRRVLLSKPLHWAVIGTEWFAWKAAGVPQAQHRMILQDHQDLGEASPGGEAIWEYIVNTLDPVVQNTLLSSDNYFYLLCLQGRYTQRCHPNYLSVRAHAKLSRPGAFDGLRIHTDELREVISRIEPGTLSHAVVSSLPFPLPDPPPSY